MQQMVGVYGGFVVVGVIGLGIVVGLVIDLVLLLGGLVVLSVVVFLCGVVGLGDLVLGMCESGGRVLGVVRYGFFWYWWCVLLCVFGFCWIMLLSVVVLVYVQVGWGGVCVVCWV